MEYVDSLLQGPMQLLKSGSRLCLLPLIGAVVPPLLPLQSLPCLVACHVSIPVMMRVVVVPSVSSTCMLLLLATVLPPLLASILEAEVLLLVPLASVEAALPQLLLYQLAGLLPSLLANFFFLEVRELVLVSQALLEAVLSLLIARLVAEAVVRRTDEWRSSGLQTIEMEGLVSLGI